MFRLLRLKPPHGWNAVIWELAIVTLGVLIALAAQQVVQAWEWRQRVAVVRQSIMAELANNRARWEADVAEARCTLGEIDELDQWVAKGEARGTAPVLRSIGSGNLFWMHKASWSLAANSQTLDHFPLDEQLAFARLYDGIENRQVDLQKVTDLIDRVLTLIPLADDAANRSELRRTLGDLRTKVALGLTTQEQYMKLRFDALGVSSDRSDFAAGFSGVSCGKEQPR
jgi:hypothetical protein